MFTNADVKMYSTIELQFHYNWKGHTSQFHAPA